MHALPADPRLRRIAESLEQRWRVDPFLTPNEIVGIIAHLAAVLSLDERNVLLRVLVVAPLAEVDTRCQMQLAQVELLGWYRLQRIIQSYTVGMVEKGNREVVRRALLVVGEEHLATGGEVRFLHQVGQVHGRVKAEIDERQRLLQVFVQPAAEGVRAGFFMEEAPGFALPGVVIFVEVGPARLQLARQQAARLGRDAAPLGFRPVFCRYGE